MAISARLLAGNMAVARETERIQRVHQLIKPAGCVSTTLICFTSWCTHQTSESKPTFEGKATACNTVAVYRSHSFSHSTAGAIRRQHYYRVLPRPNANMSQAHPDRPKPNQPAKVAKSTSGRNGDSIRPLPPDDIRPHGEQPRSPLLSSRSIGDLSFYCPGRKKDSLPSQFRQRTGQSFR